MKIKQICTMPGLAVWGVALLGWLPAAVAQQYAFTNFAGTPRQWGSADGTGSAAQFKQPTGVAVDSAGTVYVADCPDHTIRRISPAGVVTTLAGLAGQPGSADGTGSVARFNFPTGVATDLAPVYELA